MEFIKILGIGLTALFLIVILKQYKKEYAIYISIIAGILIFFLISDKLFSIIELINNLSSKSGINIRYIEILLKLTAIAYLCEFTISLCNDSGESALATKIEIGGKIIMVYLSIPIILGLIEAITEIIQ